jgi:plasmid stabilization system protein ParE
MSRRYRLTLLAERDVRDVVFYIADNFGFARAEQARVEFVKTFRLLAERPEIGRHRPELWPEPYRFWPLGPSLIAYRSDVDPIQIVRVARGSRQWMSLRRDDTR